MSLQNLLELSSLRGDGGIKQGLSEERVREQLPYLRDLVSFYREYPDICIGVEEETFKLCTIFIKYLGPVLSRTLLFYYCCYPHNLLMYCRFCVFKRGLFLDFE